MTMPVMAIASAKVRNDAAELLLRIGCLDVLHRELHVRKLSLKFRQLLKHRLGCRDLAGVRRLLNVERDGRRPVIVTVRRAAVRIRRSLWRRRRSRSKRLVVPNELVESPDDPPLEVPSSSSATDGGVCHVAADIDRGFAIGLVGDSARRAHVVLGDRVDDVGQREARRAHRARV